MAKKRGGFLLGPWAFLVGAVLALVIGVFNSGAFNTPFVGPEVYSLLLAILIIAGILVGILNVKSKESSKFLLAGLALVIVSFMGDSAISALETISVFSLGSILRSLLNALLILFIPATIIVALKSVFEITRD